MGVFNLDADLHNADWTKQSWDLPPYKSAEFLSAIKASGMNLATFKALPVYQHAVAKGLIVNDGWAGDKVAKMIASTAEFFKHD
jgi:hypothetical protein